MKKLLVLAALFCASSASAEPFTLGTWSAMNATPNSGSPFYNGKSWDCETCGISWKMQGKGVEYLHAENDPTSAASFFWRGRLALDDLGGTSDYINDHRFSHDAVSGEFALDNGHGYTASSASRGALLVRLVAPQFTDYWLWFEDLPAWRTDSDYQDRGFKWRVAVRNQTPPPVPEPATWILLCSGAAMIARRVRNRRKHGELP